MQEQHTTVAQQVEYRDVLGFPGYRVGDDGSVWSRKRPGTGDRLRKEWRALNPSTDLDGHTRVILYRNGKRVFFSTHRLILTVFVGHCPKGLEGCHNDGNPANNRLDNLRWDTPKSNYADRIRHGTQQKGERNGMSKLTAAQTQSIRSLHASGRYTFSALAIMYGVNKSTISRAIRGITWAETPTKGDS